MLDTEVMLINIMSRVLSKYQYQQLRNAVEDMTECRKFCAIIRDNQINIGCSGNIPVINPIILRKNNWTIYNISDMVINYPLVMKHCFEIVIKLFNQMHNITWQPTLGATKIEATFGNKKIKITCNILQAVALLYFNDHMIVTTESFSRDTLIGPMLTDKILASLSEVNLISIKTTSSQSKSPYSETLQQYTVNHRNYTGDSIIDIRSKFVEVFTSETEPKSYSQTIQEINTGSTGLTKSIQSKKRKSHKWNEITKHSIILSELELESLDD